MNILFVVCGEGFGHASRSTKLARHLTERGHNIVIAAYDKSLEFVKRQIDCKIYETCREVTLEGNGGYFDLKKTVASSVGIPKAFVKSYLDIRKIMQAENIDLVVADTMFAAGAAAKSLKKPVVFITNQNYFSSLAHPDAIYWKGIGKFISTYHSYLPDVVLVPDFPEPDALCGYNFRIAEKDRDKFRFIGPILDSSIYSETPSEEIIFTSFGGEPYKMPLYQMLKEIADESEDMIINVYSPAEHLPETSEHFRIIGYRENLYPEIAKAKAAIIHGGLTTLHEAVFFGKPVLMIIDPYHPEQGNNGRKVQDMNCGIMLSGDTITKESMQEALRKCLSMKPRDMSALYKKYCGIERATEIIEGFETKQSETKPADT